MFLQSAIKRFFIHRRFYKTNKKILLSKKPLKGIYNVGSGKPFTVKQILEKIKKLIKLGKINYNVVKMKKSETKKSYPNVKKIEKIFNWKSNTNLDAGLKKQLNFMKKDNPLVSIIMNCHNGEKYLKKSLQSVINQTYKNWELIFWDNRSIDKSKDIVKGFKDKRFKYFKSKKFNSLYESRNLAIKKSKGRYICFLDTDDWWLKKKLIYQIDVFRKNPKIKFIFSNVYLYFQKKKKKIIFQSKST